MDSTADLDRRAPIRRLGVVAWRYAPALVVMGLIWLGSAQERLGTDLGALDLVLRKIAHMVEYGVLWLLWHRALGWRRPAAAVAIAVGWAAIDEWHQSWVDGRHGTPVDVAIDVAGVVVAYALWRWWRERRSRPTASRARSR